MRVNCNNEILEVADSVSLGDLIAQYSNQASSVAVAVNRTIVPTSQWVTHTLDDGDVIDIFTLVAGG